MNNLVFEKEALQVILFKIDANDFAVPIEFIQEIIMNQDITLVSEKSESIEGVINLRGNIIPVIDGRKRFNFDSEVKSFDSKIIVLELKQQQIGLIVDSVSEVVHLNLLEPNALLINKTVLESNKSNCMIGIGKIDEKLVILIDPSNLLDFNKSKKIKAVLEANEALLV